MPLSYAPLTITASATLNRNTHANGPVVNLSAAAGLTVTLPASVGDGDVYRIFVRTTVTSNSDIVQVANATDVIQGTLAVSSDAAGVVIPTTATSDTITMNGTTSGGIIGSFIELRDVATGFWSVSGGLVSSGVEITPFSAAVS